MLEQIAQTAGLVFIVCVCVCASPWQDEMPYKIGFIAVCGTLGSGITILGCILINIWT